MPVPFAMAALGGSAALKALLDAALVVGSALGVSVAVTEAQRRKREVEAAKEAVRQAGQKAADDFARVGPFAEALKKAIEMAQDEDCSKRKQCPALKGSPKWIDRSKNSKLSIIYQQYITKFPPNMEWLFEGILFDGFFPERCELPEAKGRYDQFFRGGEPRFFFNTEKIYAEAIRQYKVVERNPPTILIWYFMTPIFYSYMKKIFEIRSLPIPCVFDDMKNFKPE